MSSSPILNNTEARYCVIHQQQHNYSADNHRRRALTDTRFHPFSLFSLGTNDSRCLSKQRVKNYIIVVKNRLFSKQSKHSLSFLTTSQCTGLPSLSLCFFHFPSVFPNALMQSGDAIQELSPCPYGACGYCIW